MSSTPQLDSNELMHLALHASKHGTPEQAIEHLKNLLNTEPDNGKALYLLGAIHAEIGMYDQAAEEMARALETNSELPATARFQLGLLHITAGRVAEATEVWRNLDSLGEENPLYLFKKGMLHLVNDEFEECISALRAGIDANSENEDLNNDMQKVLNDAENYVGQSDSQNQATESNSSQNMLLSIYESDDNKH